MTIPPKPCPLTDQKSTLILERLPVSLTLAVFILALLQSPTAISANPYPGYTPWQTQPPGQWKFVPPNQRQTGTPSQEQRPPQTQTPYAGSWPGAQLPGYAPQSYYRTQTETPRLETKLSLQNPYLQQGVILKLSVVSRNNLLTATPEIPQGEYFIFHLLQGPATYSRTRKGQREIVNEFFYEVTPLRPGEQQLPAIRVTGEEEWVTGYSRGNRPFEAAIQDPIRIRIHESNPESSPWLPLEQLTLKISLPKNLKAAAGRPFTLTTELNAIGMGGEQLPSLERQLTTDAFRVYREQSKVETNLDKKTYRINGRRSETFTLVPQYGGDLRLPQLSVNWWNTRNNMPQRASVPLQPIAVSGARKPTGIFGSDQQSTLFPSGASSAFWIPLSVVFGVIFGYWLAIWLRHRRKEGSQTSPLEPLIGFLQRPMRQMAPAFSPLKDKLRATTAILNPVTRWQRWRRSLVGMLPLSVRFWFCVRFVDEETDPEVWGYTLRFLANKHLSLPPNVPFSVIGTHIVDFHPKAEAGKIHALIHELEQAIYGHSELDFDRWKAAFKHQIRPSLRWWPHRLTSAKAHHKTLLPDLNPDRVASG
ncbi:MAG: BatD family protein [Candidatus Thiodiazotropha sp. (ex Dulcina madagascariensis)]|nr:BatD family protein [Candidatus Thiodiazotropha sp. (ex Dulcina madagascariensis)]